MSVIMVVFNRLKNYTHFFALSHSFKGTTIATEFMETIQKVHGNPKIFVSEEIPFSLEICGQNYFLVWVLK